MHRGIALGLALALGMAGAGPAGAAGEYRYAGYTPEHRHAGEAAALDAPPCGPPLRDWRDHVAAYVDLSNAQASRWGQTGWWLGSSPYGVILRHPSGYWEVQGADGTYRWQGVGVPPRHARFRVYLTGAVVHRGDGTPAYLARLQGAYPGGPVAEFLYPAARDWNAGLAEVYSAAGTWERLGPAAVGQGEGGGVRLWDGGRWRLWEPRLDGADPSQGHGYRIFGTVPWYRWHVAGDGG